MMESSLVALAGAFGTMAFFAFLAFAGWLDYRKKKEDSEAAHRERLKALELGYPPLDAEIERAKAYASAAWAAGLIGLLVPISALLLTFLGTLGVLLRTQELQNSTVPLIVAWSIAAVLSLVAIMRSLNVIRQLPRPVGEAPSEGRAPEKQVTPSSTAFVEKTSGV